MGDNLLCFTSYPSNKDKIRSCNQNVCKNVRLQELPGLSGWPLKHTHHANAHCSWGGGKQVKKVWDYSFPVILLPSFSPSDHDKRNALEV